MRHLVLCFSLVAVTPSFAQEKCAAAKYVHQLCSEQKFLTAELPEPLRKSNEWFNHQKQAYELVPYGPAGAKGVAAARWQASSIERCEAAISHCENLCQEKYLCEDDRDFITLQTAAMENSSEEAPPAESAAQENSKTDNAI